MKKSILFLFAFIPLFASCNNNSNGFPNPFPDDTYHPIGFNFDANNERAIRPLTSTEQALVSDTIDNPNNEYVMEHNVEIQTRDYTRAFAGAFERGYDASNISKTEKRTTFKQEGSTGPSALHRRTVTTSQIEATYDYSYGRNTSNVETTDWHYFAEEDNAKSNDVISVKETTEGSNGDYIISQISSTESSTNTATMLAKYDASWTTDPDIVFSQGLEHSEFLMKLLDCSSTPGADKDDNVILVKVEQKKYKDPSQTTEEGIYELPDGRRYQAMQNSMTVSKLVLQKATNDSDWDEDWYLVSYARKYTETTITSDIIQPNVPISMLANPIVINYTEEKHNFDIKTDLESKEEDPEATIEVEEIE